MINIEEINRSLREVFRGFSVVNQQHNEGIQENFVGTTWFPITSFYLEQDEAFRFSHAKFPYSVEIASGVIHRESAGTLRSIQIRIPISCVEDSSYDEKFVQACCEACDESFERLHGQIQSGYDIRLYSGLVMVFYNINEQAFLDYDAPTRKECISFFLKNLSAALFYIRSSLNAKGYGKMF